MSVDARVDELLRVFTAPGANAAHLLCDRHPADAVAFTVIEADLSSRDVTYGELRDASSRFAGGLAGLGVSPGEAVAVLMGKSAELVIALLGIWRLGAVHVPLFTAFASPAIALRLEASGAPYSVRLVSPQGMVVDGSTRQVRAPSRVPFSQLLLLPAAPLIVGALIILRRRRRMRLPRDVVK